MTITTAKQPLRLAPLAAALLVALPAQVQAQGLVRNLAENLSQNVPQELGQTLAETSLRLLPTLSVTETWTDNVNLQAARVASEVRKQAPRCAAAAA